MSRYNTTITDKDGSKKSGYIVDGTSFYSDGTRISEGSSVVDAYGKTWTRPETVKESVSQKQLVGLVPVIDLDGKESIISGRYAFNQPLTIPSGVTSIGASFLYQCYSFTLLEYNSSASIIDNNSMSQTIHTKTSANGTGIKVIGTNAAELRSKLQDREVSPFRKLV